MLGQHFSMAVQLHPSVVYAFLPSQGPAMSIDQSSEVSIDGTSRFEFQVVVAQATHLFHPPAMNAAIAEAAKEEEQAQDRESKDFMGPGAHDQTRRARCSSLWDGRRMATSQESSVRFLFSDPYCIFSFVSIRNMCFFARCAQRG